MVHLSPRVIYEETPDGKPKGKPVATMHPASHEVVQKVLKKRTDALNGRSPYMWVRLSTGDLVLGVIPQGDTFFDVKKDSEYPGNGEGNVKT